MKICIMMVVCVFFASQVYAYQRITAESVSVVQGAETNVLQDVIEQLSGDITGAVFNASANSEDIAMLNGNFGTTSNSVRVLAAIVETNAFMDDLNSGVGNANFVITSNLFFQYLGATGIQYQKFTTNAYAVTTNLTAGITNVYGLITGNATSIVGNSSSIAANTGAIGINSGFISDLNVGIDAINANFSAISNDFVAVSNYLLGAAGLVPALDTAREITETNFLAVNANSKVWSNAITVLAEAIATSMDAAPPTVDLAYSEMNVDYPSFPSSLNITFPSLIGVVSNFTDGAIDGATPGIVQTTIYQTVIAAVSDSPWEIHDMTVNSVSPDFVSSALVNQSAIPFGFYAGTGLPCDAMVLSGLDEGLYMAQGHIGSWVSPPAPWVIFGGYPPNPGRPYKYIVFDSGQTLGDFAFMFSVDSTYPSLGMFSPVTNRAMSAAAPVYIQVMKLGVTL